MFAAFHLPDLRVAAALLEEPQAAAGPCALLQDEAQNVKPERVTLAAVNGLARQRGIEAGWRLNKARVRCPELRLLTAQPQREAALFAELLLCAEGFSPDFEATAQDLVLVDLSRARAAQRAALSTLRLPSSGLALRCVGGATPDLAQLALGSALPAGAWLDEAELRQIPLEALRALLGAAPWFAILELWGLRCLGEFLDLPRAELTLRLGAEAGDWHDRLHGRRARLLRLHRIPEDICQRLDFESPLGSAEAVLFALNRLLHGLCARVAVRRLALSRLELTLRLDWGEPVFRELNLPEPSLDPEELQRPLQMLLDDLRLEAPVVAVELDGATALPSSAQRDWLTRQLRHPQRWGETLARLEALLGPGRWGVPLPPTDHRPDGFLLQPAPRQTEIELPLPSLESALIPEVEPVTPIPLRRFRPARPVAVASQEAAFGEDWPRPLALLDGAFAGAIEDWRGPFPLSGQWWEAQSWRQLEWDIEVLASSGRRHLLRLTHRPPHRWQLEGEYA